MKRPFDENADMPWVIDLVSQNPVINLDHPLFDPVGIADYLRWKYSRVCPEMPSHIYMPKSIEKAKAVLFCRRQLASDNGEKRVCQAFLDSASNEKENKWAYASAFLSFLKELKTNRSDIIIGAPTEKIARIILSTGRAFRPCAFCILSCGVDGMFEMIRGFGLETIADINTWQFQWPKGLFMPFARTKEQLSWRFFSLHPLKERFQYRMVLLKGKQLGYIVFAYSQRDKTIYIMDFLINTSVRMAEAFRLFLSKILEELIGLGFLPVKVVVGVTKDMVGPLGLYDGWSVEKEEPLLCSLPRPEGRFFMTFADLDFEELL